MEQILENEVSTLKETLVEVRLLRQENKFLKQQLQVAQTFQAKMGLTLDKITISDLFDKKAMESKARDLSESHMEKYREGRYYFLQWCNARGLEYADEVTVDYTHEFWNWFSVTPGKAGKVLGRFQRIGIWKTIKATFQYAETRNSIIRNPFQNKVFPVTPVRDWWDDEYYNNLIDAIRKYTKPSNRHKLETVVRCLYTTGLRVSLFLAVEHRNVKIDGDSLFITTKRKVPKSSAIQEITIEILNEKAKEMFLEHYKPGNPGKVFTNSSNSLRQSLTKICKKDRLKYLSPHKAKHGFITKMLQKGYTAEQICKLTGNSTPSLINQVYNHIKASDFVDRVKADIEDL